MILKNFRINCTFRVILLSTTIFLFFYLILNTSLYAILLVIGCLLIYQIYSLIYYVEKTNRDINRFFEAIKFEDFSQTFRGAGLGSSFKELKTSFTEVLNKFRQTRAEKEEHYHYLQTVVQHIGIGLISFQHNGDVELINSAAKRLLHVPYLKNIKSIKKYSDELVNTLFKMRTGEKTLVKVQDNDELVQLAIYAVEFILRNKKVKLVSIQNIQSELEEQEMNAWQKLIRVLTHEIMNSVTPIASLASTVNEMLIDTFPDKSDYKTEESFNDIHSAIQTIEKRSQGLINFVESYRKLTRIPKPNFQIFLVSSIFNRVMQLIRTQISDKGIKIAINVEPATLEVTADSELIEQVLINLLINATHAIENVKNASIILRSRLDEKGRVTIQVIDNGTGIIKDVQEKIFIPFFTTKREGSGIGLSLSKQIMRLHKGTISVQSEPNIKTIFTLRF